MVLVEDRKNWHRMASDLEFTVLDTVASVLKSLYVFTDALAGVFALSVRKKALCVVAL